MYPEGLRRNPWLPYALAEARLMEPPGSTKGCPLMLMLPSLQSVMFPLINDPLESVCCCISPVDVCSVNSSPLRLHCRKFWLGHKLAFDKPLP